ncbi:MAG: acyl-CoA dehydrogenase [Chloroflexi bacterium]|jgi:butyryl-CoA dehydrogenase|nr:acyl-CoA dehydrogenase [Chloroflexota bacterium]MBT3668679.1 acyl-CoA dehydrogenase [Chloroflexota bacterium]MBT4001918.1 acyl-CoA dehydrogenase [Chloroflexota bacterium]MBT4305380.1 acyl-CoA dehydrogenase [Chloroflexota bacterium]MBT4532526.1 acyl-CoA dehydrogenase [Chloroflexota bacterium]
MDFDLSKEQKLWQATVHAFAEKELRPRAHEIDLTGKFNWEATKKMGPLGLLGMMVPEEFGGSEMDTLDVAIAIEELGWGCGSTALAISAHNGLGCAPLANFGSEELKRQFLPKVVSGEGKLAALALTEPGGGSDLKGSIQTKAEKKGTDWVINGSKMWITNPGVGEFVITLVRTDPDSDTNAYSLILVPIDAKGLHVGPAEKKMGLNGSMTHALSYDNVTVPEGYLIGEEGHGLKYTLQTLDSGRVSIGALSIGLARAAHEVSMQYAKDRKMFGKTLADKQAIQWMIADAATEIKAARLMVYHAANLKDKGKPFTKEAAMAKLFASEMSERVCRNAIQILGGYGYSREYPVERFYRDTRLMTIGEGTSEIQRLVISRLEMAGK